MGKNQSKRIHCKQIIANAVLKKLRDSFLFTVKKLYHFCAKIELFNFLFIVSLHLFEFGGFFVSVQ
jgi:hypothetical protein